MKTVKTTRARAKDTGRYTFDSDLDRLCVCGRALGVHTAEAPHLFDDMTLDPREGLPKCKAFKPAKT